MNYKVEDYGNSCFGVVETSKDNEIIMTFLTMKEAKNCARQMNAGKIGFDGWTPSFMVKETPMPEDMEDDEDDSDVLE
jgi:hypothetical protein